MCDTVTPVGGGVRKRLFSLESDKIDLLFYHSLLGRLIAIDLKLGPFQAVHKGQMELHLRWLEKHEIKPSEETPLGLILCADKSSEKIELLRLDESGIHVASYLTELPPIDVRAINYTNRLHELSCCWKTENRKQTQTVNDNKIGKRAR